MIYLDLKWLLFASLIVIICLPILTIFLFNQYRRRQQTASLGTSMLVPNEQTLFDILKQAPFGYLVLSGEDDYRYANAYACRLLELTTPAGRLSETPWRASLLADRQAARQSPTVSGRYRYVPLPFNRFIQWWVFPATEKDQTDQTGQTNLNQLDVVFVLDVTARQQARQRAQLLFSGFSHELRTPIATILTHLEILSSPNIAPDIEAQSLHLLKQEAQRMSKLVNQVLLLGRLESEDSFEYRPVNLLLLVEETLAQTTPLAAEKGLTLSLEADAPLAAVGGDDHRLRQVFLNLLENAIKYTQPGGQITVSLHQDPNSITCVVADNGPGIPEENLPHITRHFYRAAPQEIAGSGLGLAIVSEILQRHQSSLQIESATTGKNIGTRVSFALPLLITQEE